MNIDKLLEALHVPQELIDAYKAEKLPENAQELIQNYLKSREEFYKSTDDFKSMLQTERDKAFAGTQLSVIKSLNSALGINLTNSDIKDFKKVEDFIPRITEFYSKQIEASGTKTDEKLRTELNDYKTKMSEYKTLLDEAQTQLVTVKEKATKEVEEFKNSYEASSYFDKLVLSDEELMKLDIPGKDFAISSIKREIFSNFIINKDGTVLSKDGTKAIHPEKDTNVNNVSELFSYYKNKAGLIKRSNAGVKILGKDGKPLTGNEGISDAAAQKMRELQEKRR